MKPLLSFVATYLLGLTPLFNDSGSIAGYYADANNVYHGFVRDPQGNITSFDPPLSHNTYVYGMNLLGAICGQYVDAGNIGHGFVRSSQGVFTYFDGPGSTATFPYGVNDFAGWLDSTSPTAARTVFTATGKARSFCLILPGARIRSL